MFENALYKLKKSWTVRVAVIVGFLQAIISANYSVALGIAGSVPSSWRLPAYFVIFMVTYVLPIVLTRIFHITPEKPDGLERPR